MYIKSYAHRGTVPSCSKGAIAKHHANTGASALHSSNLPNVRGSKVFSIWPPRSLVVLGPVNIRKQIKPCRIRGASATSKSPKSNTTPLSHSTPSKASPKTQVTVFGSMFCHRWSKSAALFLCICQHLEERPLKEKKIKEDKRSNARYPAFRSASLGVNPVSISFTTLH